MLSGNESNGNHSQAGEHDANMDYDNMKVVLVVVKIWTMSTWIIFCRQTDTIIIRKS